MKSRGVESLTVHLGSGAEWFESGYFYKKHGYVPCSADRMTKKL